MENYLYIFIETFSELLLRKFYFLSFIFIIISILTEKKKVEGNVGATGGTGVTVANDERESIRRI